MISSYPPNTARLSEYSKYLVEELEKLSTIDSIQVLADTVKGKTNCTREGEKILIHRAWKPDNPLSILSLLGRVIRVKPDVVHLNVHFQSFGRSRITNFTGLSLIPLLNLLGFKVLVTLHNLADKIDLRKVSVDPNPLNKLGINLATRFILTADAITVTVKSYVNYLRRAYDFRRTVHIKHGTRKISNKKKPKREYSNILIFGHMGPHKGLETMLEAFKDIRNMREKVRLIVAGKDHPNFPGYIESLREEEIPDVIYTGYVPEEKIEDIFLQSDVVVIPYLTTTGTSGVFHLACGYGRPIIASDLPEIRELISEGSSALLVEPGSSEELENAVIKILDNPELAGRMGDRNLAFASEETWQKIAQDFVQVYVKLMEKDLD
jgi:glycosyltransferase involved in cell wall biosynthesis